MWYAERHAVYHNQQIINEIISKNALKLSLKLRNTLFFLRVS